MKKLFLLSFVFAVLFSCSSIKSVPEDQHLLTKNIVFVDGKKTNDEEVHELISLKPNSKTLGLPFSLYFYHFGDEKRPKTPSEWGKKNPKTYNFFKSVFSEKQSIALAKNLIDVNKWFLKNGEAPSLLNIEKVKNSAKNIDTYYNTIGYFRAHVEYDTLLLKNKKATVEYKIERGNPTILDSIITDIKSPVLDSIYKKAKTKSFLKKGEIFNQQNFINEANRITKLYRNNGIYHFQDDFLGFYDIDSINPYYRTNVRLVVSGEKLVDDQGNYNPQPLKIQRLRNINVYTDYSFSNRSKIFKDTATYKNIKFLAFDKVRYNPKLLSQSIFLESNQIYSDSLRNQTRTHLKGLKNFKGTNLKYKPVPGRDDQLDVDILLTPIEKYTLGLETELYHSNIRDLGISGKFSIINRNTFKGAEIFKLSFLGSFFNASQNANQTNAFLNSWEIGADISLEVPRLLTPFGLFSDIDKNKFPTTYLSLGTSLQKNIGLDRQNFTGIYNYRWKPSSKTTLELETLNLQYVKTLRIERYFDVYDSELNKLREVEQVYTGGTIGNNPLDFINLVLSDNNFFTTNPEEYKTTADVFNRYGIITSDFIIPTLSLAYTYNTQNHYKDTNFSFFRARLANSGNFFSLFSKDRSNGKKTLFKIPLAQYIKLDLEYKKFWKTSASSVFGFRTFLGVIFPYDNSGIPFTKSYFAGGSNDIRAWQTYSLGPGTRQFSLEYNIGSLKFLTSAEYRFDLFGSIKGATFIDLGNIWDIQNSNFNEEEAKFHGLSSLKDIAIGSGFGLRYDLNFLVVRLDLGFKMYEPYLTSGRWFKNHNFSNAVYNIGINYPF